MKKIYKFLSLTLVLGLLLTTSCEKWIDPDINVTPNRPTDVPMKFLLPSIEANIAYDLGGNDLVRTTHLWLQYFNGYARQSLAEMNYSYRPSDCNNLWTSAYYGTLMDLKLYIAKAEESNSPHVAGVGKVLTALVLGNLTDIWGDIPWSEALQGVDNLNPKLDSQESIYAAIQELLDQAITDLQASESVYDIEADLFYDGDVDLWLKTAYALKARYYLNLTKVDAGNYAKALAAVANAYTSNDDNFMFPFGENSSENNPIYQFMDQRGDITMCSTFIDMTNDATNWDYRLLGYATLVNGDFYGGAPGSQDNTDISVPGDYIAAKDAPVRLMTYAECKFIEAEAQFHAGNTTAAYNAYLDGVAASVLDVLWYIGYTSLDRSWLEGTGFWNNVIAVGENNLTLENIMTQKYVALYGQFQPFNDWRRTGFPKLTPVTGSQMPRRYPYPQSEISYNTNFANAAEVTIFDKVWWDK